MKLPEHYDSDVLFFFDGRPLELSLYEALFRHMEADFPAASVKVQKSQISFYGRHLFGAVSLPVRRKKDWPEHCIVVTVGLPYRLESTFLSIGISPCGRGCGTVSQPLDTPCADLKSRADRRRITGLAAGSPYVCGEQAVRFGIWAFIRLESFWRPNAPLPPH